MKKHANTGFLIWNEILVSFENIFISIIHLQMILTKAKAKGKIAEGC